MLYGYVLRDSVWFFSPQVWGRVLILTFYSGIGRGLVWNRVSNFTFHSGVGHGHGRSGIGCAFITLGLA